MNSRVSFSFLLKKYKLSSVHNKFIINDIFVHSINGDIHIFTRIPIVSRILTLPKGDHGTKPSCSLRITLGARDASPEYTLLMIFGLGLPDIILSPSKVKPLYRTWIYNIWHLFIIRLHWFRRFLDFYNNRYAFIQQSSVALTFCVCNIFHFESKKSIS